MMYLLILKTVSRGNMLVFWCVGFFTSPQKVLDQQYLNKSLFETIGWTCSLLRVTEKLSRFSLCHLTEARFFQAVMGYHRSVGYNVEHTSSSVRERSKALRLYFHNQNHLGPSSPITRQKMVIHQIMEGGRDEELRYEGTRSGIQKSGMECLYRIQSNY